MIELLKGRFKCDFGGTACESMNLYVGYNVDTDIWKNMFELMEGCVIHNFQQPNAEIIILTEKPLKFLDDKSEICISKYNIKSKNNVHISFSKSEVCFENLDIYDEDGFHLYNAKMYK